MQLTRRQAIAGIAAAAVFTPRAAFADYDGAARYSADRRGVSLLVMVDGRIVVEDYPNEGALDRGWELASGTKSFTGVIAAALAHDGRLALEERCSDTLREWRNDDRRAITIRHLLTLTSGITGGGIGRPPPYAEAVALQPNAAPGVRFQYGPAPFQLFGEIVRRKLGEDPVVYLQRRVLDRIGVRPTAWRRGRDGNSLMPQGAQFTARDWAQFGDVVMRNPQSLDLDRGVYEALWMGTTANPGYGLSWWLLRPGLIGPSPLAGVNAETIGEAVFRTDVRMAAGAGDQRLYLAPELNTVIVRQASGILRAMRDRSGARWSDGEFLSQALPLG
jgi:CubicO group peptidase (beta-lactamase class C family)